MKRGGGKRKGSAFERRIAQALSLWLTKKKDRRQLIRSVLSGGWQGAQEKDGWRQVGDLAPNGPIGERFRRRYAVECKHRRQINLLELWQKGGKKEPDSIRGWWRKLCRDSKAAGVTPMLIFRSNGFPIMVGVPIDHAATVSTFQTAVRFPQYKMLIVPFDEMLQTDPAQYL